MSLDRNAAFGDMADLLAASMDELDALPPLAIPPTGRYVLNVICEAAAKEGREFIASKFSVITVEEVKNADEADEVKPGQLFNNSTYLKKKGSDEVNKTGIAAFVSFMEPFKVAFFPDQSVTVGEMMQRLSDGVQISATVVRTARKDAGGEIIDDQYNFRLKDIVVL